MAGSAPQQALEAARRGDIDGALARIRVFLKLRPDDLEGLLTAGYLLAQQGRHEQALANWTKAVARHPGSAAAHVTCGVGHRALGRPQDAVRHYARALELAPDDRDALIGMIRAHSELGESSRALAAAERCLAEHPGWIDAWLAKADALAALGDLDGALSELDRLLGANPGNPVACRLSAHLSNLADMDPRAVHVRHLAAAGGRPAIPRAAPRDPDPGRPLTVGVLSSDLRRHSVGQFAQAFMRGVPAGWRMIGFMNGPMRPGDAMAAEFRSMCDGWVMTAGMDDRALEEAIRSRGVDVLVELNGNSSGNRLDALDRRPAPVIVTAIGYPNTTGHPCIDWRIVDSVTDPPGAEAFCTERLLRIDPCFLCYAPTEGAPVPRIPEDGAPNTFGSFNLAQKICDRTAALWSRALAAAPGSRLLLKSVRGSDAGLCARLIERLARAGIPPHSVEILDRTETTADHLALYSRVHVALDTTPYNGTTTTCEALWMGVPVVTIEGDRHAARVGSSLLRAAGLPELVARTPEEFASTAAALATDRARLESLRHGLRDRMRASALMDAGAYAARFHAALRHAWRERCMEGST